VCDTFTGIENDKVVRMGSNYEDWDRVYREYPPEDLPWERGTPREGLVELVEAGEIKIGKALDTCCGAGTNDIYLAKKGFEVTGLDISKKAVEIAKKRAERENVRIEFMVRNFLELPFEDEEFDFVLDSGCFHHVHVEDRSKYINGVHRVLKTGGRYFLLCFSYKNGPAWNHFTRKQIVQLFSEHFRILTLKHIESKEGDAVYRFFYNALMEKREI
jgi:ubiquinone/menaquinone biosynthesis C-methylase UbiE